MGAHAEGDILVEAGDFLDAHAGGGDQFVAGDDRANVDLAGSNGDVELAEDAHEISHVAGVFVVGALGGGGGLFLEQGERGKLVVLLDQGHGGRLGLFGFLGFDDGDGAEASRQFFQGGLVLGRATIDLG